MKESLHSYEIPQDSLPEPTEVINALSMITAEQVNAQSSPEEIKAVQQALVLLVDNNLTVSGTWDNDTYMAYFWFEKSYNEQNPDTKISQNAICTINELAVMIEEISKLEPVRIQKEIQTVNMQVGEDLSSLDEEITYESPYLRTKEKVSADEKKRAEYQKMVDQAEKTWMKNLREWLDKSYVPDKLKDLADGTFVEVIAGIYNQTYEEREATVTAAISAVEKGDIMGAGHCTDWVNKVIESIDMKQINVFNTFGYNAEKDLYYHTGEMPDAGIDKIIREGYHIVYKNNNGATGYHSAVVEKVLDDGKFQVLSYGGSGYPPRRHEITLGSKGMPLVRVRIPYEDE